MIASSFKSRLLALSPAKRAIADHSFIAVLSFFFLNLYAAIVAIGNPSLAFGVLLGGYITLGTIHFKTLYKIHPWADIGQFTKEVSFTISLTLLALIMLSMCLGLISNGAPNLPFAMTPIYFMLPFFIGKTLDEAGKAPEFVVPGAHIDDLESAAEKDIFASTDQYVNFLFDQEEERDLPHKGHLGYYSVQPEKIEGLSLKEIFETHLLMYNKYINGTTRPIEFQTPYKWSFYINRSFGNGKFYLDPKATLAENSLAFRKKKDNVVGVLGPVYKIEIQVERTIDVALQEFIVDL